jgi:hypothetical protein
MYYKKKNTGRYYVILPVGLFLARICPTPSYLSQGGGYFNYYFYPP